MLAQKFLDSSDKKSSSKQEKKNYLYYISNGNRTDFWSTIQEVIRRVISNQLSTYQLDQLKWYYEENFRSFFQVFLN